MKAGEIQGVVEIPLNAAILGPSFIMNPAFHTKTRTQVGHGTTKKIGCRGMYNPGGKYGVSKTNLR